MTLRQKRRRLTQWLRSIFSGRRATEANKRRISIEPLEQRQLLASDAFMALLGSSFENRIEETSPAPFVAQTQVVVSPEVPTAVISESAASTNELSVEAEGELNGEGEPQQDLVAFAQAIRDSGSRFFGAGWCSACTEQKELFEDGGKFLPFEEVTNPDRSLNQLGIDENINVFPTWQFPDNTRAEGVLTLQELATRTGVAITLTETPTFDTLPDVQVEQRAPLHVPVDAYDPDGDPLTITVTSSDPSLIQADVLQGNRSVRFDVQGYGDMVFELFEQRAPRPSGRVIELAQDGFYDGIIFHRVIDGFVIQGGDPLGTGTGGSSLGDFDDQFHLDLQHNSTGILSYAKSTDDTNDSQFFITEGQQRHLDFNHSVFGVLIEGEDNREAISGTETASGGRPTNTVTINSATIFNDTENGTIVLRPTGTGTGIATITVVVTDSDGNSSSQQFQAGVITDTTNGAPFLDDIAILETQANTPVEFDLTSQDKEGDTVLYQVSPINGQPSFGLQVAQNTGRVTVTPPQDFTGQLQFSASVRQTNAATTSSPDDNQVVTLNVVQGNAAPTAIDLQAASDSGVNTTDNITNLAGLVFDVTGTVSGATVEIVVGGNVVGSATAAGATTAVTVTNAVALGEGTIAFAARQTQGTSVSELSPTLNVVLDRTGPSEIGTGVIPVSGVADRPISVNIEGSEEGQGLTYQLSGAPDGMTLNATTGQLDWTPTAAQVGDQSFSVIMQDAAGNSTNQQFTVNVVIDPIVAIDLQVVDAGGNPLTTVDVGTEFRVLITVQDLRGVTASGLFAAFADLQYNSSVIEPIGTNPITGIAPFENGVRGDITTAGVIDELGAFTTSTQPSDGGIQGLVEVAFRAIAIGNAGLELNPADETPQSDTLTFDSNPTVPLDRIEFGSSAFSVGADFAPADDIFNFDEDAAQQTLAVQSNDDVGNSTLNIVELSTPTGGGAVSISSDSQSVLYTPAANFNGAEIFTYTVENQAGIQGEATVTIQITAVNDPPVAIGDSFNVSENSSLNIFDVLANDNSGVDSSRETLTVSAVGTGSAGGTILIGSSGSNVSYTPRPDFRGTETFTYTISDGNGGTATATVNANVEVANPPPIAMNDSFTVEEDAFAATFDLLSNDTTDDPTETLSISAVGTSQNGSVFQVSGGGTNVTYQPAQNFSGLEILTYTIRDSGGAEATGLVTFSVNPVNDAPMAVADTSTVISSQASSNIAVLANDSDPDTDDSLTITSVTQPSSGTVAIASDNQSIDFSPPSSDFEGIVTFDYTVSDGTLTSIATVTVTVANFVPRAISGQVENSQLDSLAFSRFAVSLTGTDDLGESINRTEVVSHTGGYSFDSLAPGQYQLRRDPLPFLDDAGQTIDINSAATDGDAVQNLQVNASLRPQFFGIRDFLGSTIVDVLTVAVADDGTPAWVSARGAWSELTTLDVNLADDTLSVTGVDAGSNNLQGSLNLADASTRAYEAGRESDFRLLRIPGTPTDAGVAATGGASGEGEAPASLKSTIQPEAQADTTPTDAARRMRRPLASS